jgi:peptidoglycan/xylan/chitin deacetylase (PgdA/CDA1 family)
MEALMRTAIVGGLVVAVALAAGGVVLAQKGSLPKAFSKLAATEAVLTTGTVIQAAAAGAATALPAPAVATAQSTAKPAVTAPSVAAPAAAPAAPRAAAAPVPPAPPCDNPNAMGVARVVQIDTTGGPGFGFEHFKTHDFLRNKEVVLTFDDGPWPGNTPAVLAALKAECLRATFFPIGKHSIWHPEILRQVAAEGHTIGTHTWSHKDLSKLTLDQAKEEIEKGVSAVHAALEGPSSSLIRFPALRHPPDVVAYIGERNMGIFSTDIDSFDFKTRNPQKVVTTVMSKLDKLGKGIILMHDFQRDTAAAMPELIKQLKAGGYKVVHVTTRDMLATLPTYDAEITKELGGPGMTGAAAKPTSSVVRTISGE